MHFQRLLAITLCGLLSRGMLADNWPTWRGPALTGVSSEPTAPLEWSPTKGVRWKVPLSQPGMSSPIVWGDRVFLTQPLDKEGRQRALTCFARKDGKQLWQSVVAYSEKEATYDPEPHYCSASPVTDGERVVAFFASAGLYCYSMDGKELWHKELGKCEQLWGTASSPIITKDSVILNFGPGERTFLISFDKKTGAERWRITVPGKFGATQQEWMGTWSTPIISQRDGRDELLVPWPGELKCYDPATGREIWSAKGGGQLNYTSPLVSKDVVVQMSGFMGPAIGVQRGGSGEVTNSHRLWREEKNPQRIGSGIVLGDHIYMVNENGVAQCIELKTGKTLWTERATSTTWASLVCVAGMLYVTSKQGETVVLAAKPTFEVLARNTLGERCNSTIAVSNGDLFIRTSGHLWCIGKP